jgi:hypothetical protein
MRVVERIVDLPTHPPAVKQHREFAGYGYHRSFLCVLATAFGNLEAMTPEVRVLTKGTKDVVSAAYQKPPQHLVTFFGDALLRISISRPIGGRH